MRLFSVLTAVVVVLALVANVDAAGKAKKKAKAKPVTGTVSAIKKDDGKDTGTFTIKVKAKKKKGAPAPEKPEEKTFKITDTTKFETGSQKKTDPVTAAKFSDLAEGKSVSVTTDGETATSVKIMPAKKKKKTK